jgi:dihydroorotase
MEAGKMEDGSEYGMKCGNSMEMPAMDLILTNGMVVDPFSNIYEKTDVGIRDKKIAAIGKDLARNASTMVIDCAGLYVAPGLVDLHVHLFEHRQERLGLNPDEVMINGGVTTMVDAGSSGSSNWAVFRDDIVRKSRARVLSLINLSKIGLDNSQELMDPTNSDPEGTVRIIKEEPGLAVGVKIRAGERIIGEGEQGQKHIRQAIRAARESGSRLMVHIGNSPMTIPEIAAELSAGDIITHCYKGGIYRNKVLDDNGRVFPELFKSADNGVLFDVGHGAASFDWDVAEAAIDQGFLPSTISTDLHRGSVGGPVYDMPQTMTKFLLLGFSMNEVVRLSTIAPAKALGMDDRIGSLKPGYCADVTVLGWKSQDIDLFDGCKKHRSSKGYLYCAGVIRAGKVIRMDSEI